MKKLLTLLGSVALAISVMAGSGLKYEGTATVASGATNALVAVDLGTSAGSDEFLLESVEARISSGTGTGTVAFAIASIGDRLEVAKSSNLSLTGATYRNYPKRTYSVSSTQIGTIPYVTNDVMLVSITTNTVTSTVYENYQAKTIWVMVGQPATNAATAYKFSIHVK